LPAENFSVLRVRRSVLRNSDVGLIFTNRTPTGVAQGVDNLAVGVDANLRVFGALFVNSYVAGTRTGADDARAARLSVGWRDRLWNTSAAIRQVGEDFNPGIGFVRRRDIRESYATVGIHPRPDIPHVLELSPYVETTYTTDLGGRLETRESQAGLGVSFDDRSSVSLTYSRRFERLDVPFRVRAETSIPVGDYRFGEGSARYSSSQGQALSFNAGVSGGGYYDGTRLTLTGGVRWQPDRHLVLDLDANHNAVTVQGDSFSADLYGARIQYAVSTTLNFSGFVQYNHAADEVVTNLRADLIHAPLSDLFLLYTERRSTSGPGILERFLTVKVTRLLLF
ncbi:MAG TPA: hypothetical protein VJ997_12625, partial [Longimicrobiales bacterium]|nr:hypothetical protein [Longimicrobiales bacterium]